MNLEGQQPQPTETSPDKKSLKERMVEYQKSVAERFVTAAEQAIERVSANPYFRDLESTSF